MLYNLLSDTRCTDELLSQLRACVDEKAQEWRLRAASAMLVLSEVIYGASPAWTDISGWRHLDAASWHMNEAGMFQAALVSTAAAAVDEVMSPALFSASEGTRKKAHGPHCHSIWH